jgi:hypothetical protein
LAHVITSGDYFRFGSVFIKKNNQTEFLKKKLKPVQTDWSWFGSVRFFRIKTGSTWFSVWLGFFRFGFGSFFSVLGLYNQTELIGFFKILIGLIEFFSRFDFSVIFF